MPPKLGILAGGGDLPARIIQLCRDTGREFFVIAFEEQATPECVAGTPHAWVRLGAAGKALKALREAGAEELVMAGAIRRPSLASLRPDAWGARLLAKAGPAAFGDDGLLSMVVRELEESEGFRVIAPEHLVPEMLAPAGTLGAVEPDAAALRDIERGVSAARAIGALDIGQAAVVQEGVVLALEAVEGTDAMLVRCAGLRRESPGGVLVKVRKPGQERRVDLPTIGVATVRAAAAAGLGGIAIEAGGALVIDRTSTIAAADAAGLFVVGVTPEEDATA
jgi:DUF1009 family protein